MYFKTLRTSDTGQKLTAIHEKAAKYQNEMYEFLKTIGASNAYEGYNYYKTGVSGIIFPYGYDVPKHFKRISQGYWPNLRYKEGKKIHSQISDLPVVRNRELNACVGLRERFSRIGYCKSNKDYQLFEVDKESSYTPPSDCIEITSKEYEKLSQKP